MKKTAQGLLAFSSLALLLNVAHAQDQKSFVGEKLLPSPAQVSQAVLGKGYDVEQERFAGDCVSGDVQYAGAQQSSVSFERSMSSSEMSDSLGFSLGARARYGMISGSLAARFASESTSNDYSEVTIYSADYRFKNAKLHEAQLTSLGEKASQGQDNRVWENWEATCGQGYVEQIQLGAKFMISAKVEFASKEDKMAFAAEFKIKGPAFSVGAELSKASSRFGKSAAVAIRAFQLGGDVSRITSLFGAGDGARVEVDGKKVHALLVCSMDNLNACMRVLDNAITYATDKEDPHSFPNQIQPHYTPDQPSGPADLGYIVKPWSDLAFYLPPQIMKEVVKTSRAELGRIFEELLQIRTRVNALLSGPFRLSTRQYDAVDKVSQALNGNLAKVMDAVTLCYSDPEMCPARIRTLKDELSVIDRSSLDIYPETFSQWCDLFESGTIRGSAKNTVSALLDMIGRDLDTSKTTDKCSMAESILSEKREIDLGMKGIESLAPMALLVRLETLYLHGNEIHDLGALKNMSALRKLNINGNQVRDLAPLAGLSSLQILLASGNRIEDLPEHLSWTRLHTLWLGDNHLVNISALAPLLKLEELRLNNNRIANIDSLELLTMLRSLNLSNNRVGDFNPLVGLRSLVELEVANNPGKCPLELVGACASMEL